MLNFISTLFVFAFYVQNQAQSQDIEKIYATSVNDYSLDGITEESNYIDFLVHNSKLYNQVSANEISNGLNFTKIIRQYKQDTLKEELPTYLNNTENNTLINTPSSCKIADSTYYYGYKQFYPDPKFYPYICLVKNNILIAQNDNIDPLNEYEPTVMKVYKDKIYALANRKENTVFKPTVFILNKDCSLDTVLNVNNIKNEFIRDFLFTKDKVQFITNRENLYSYDYSNNLIDSVSVHRLTTMSLNERLSYSYFSSRQIDDSTHLIVSDYSNSYTNTSYLKILSINNKSEITEIVPKLTNTDNYNLGLFALDFLDTNYIYTSNNKAVFPDHIPNSPAQNIGSVVINCFDKQGNQKFVKTIGGDAHYYSMKTKATKDKGCLVLMNRAEFGNPNNDNIDLYIIKLDSLGNVETNYLGGSITVEENREEEFKVFQQGSQLLFSENLVNSTIKIYTPRGALIHTEFVHDNFIDISSFKTGAYFMKFIGVNGIVKHTKKVLLFK